MLFTKDWIIYQISKLTANIKKKDVVSIFIVSFALYFGFIIFTVNKGYSNGSLLISDSYAFLTAGKIIREGKIDQIYNPVLQKQTQSQIVGIPALEMPSYFAFFNPPYVSIPYTLLANMPLKTSHLIIVSGGFFILAGFVYYTIKKLEFKKESLFFSLGVLSYFPFYTSLINGQVSLLFLPLVVLIYSLIKKRRLFISGLLGSLFFIKFTLITIPLLIMFGLQRSKEKVSYIKGFITGGLVQVLLSTLLVEDYFRKNISIMLNLTGKETGIALGNKITRNVNILSLFDYVNSIINSENTTFIVLLSLTLLLIVFSALFIIKTKNLNKAFSASILFGTLFSIHVKSSDLLLLLFPMFLLFREALLDKHNRDLKYLLIFTLLVCPLMSYLAFGPDGYSPAVFTVTTLLGSYLILFKDKNSNIFA